MTDIVIVGVGALGSHVVQFLRSVGANLAVVDFDRIEQKNCLAQFHAKGHVGKSKVVAIQQSMQYLWGAKIQGSNAKLTPTNDKELLGNALLVIDCLDNGDGRRVIQNYVRKNSVACLHGALAADGAFGRVTWDEKFVIDDEGGAGQATCEGGEHLPFIAMVASYIARATQDFLVKGAKYGYQISPAGVLRI
jgi:molybdopterin/thiamine biosynthesis adenylyltransferase